MLLITILKRFVAVLIFPGDPELAKKRALAALVRDFAKTGPRWYEPWSNRISRDFALAVDKIAAAVSRADSLFSATILAEGKERQKVEDALIDVALRKEGRALEELGFAAIRAAAADRNAPDLLVEMDAIFRERLAVLNSPAVTEVAASHAALLRLASFCAYRFSDISESFAPAKNGSKPPARIPAADLLHILEDLYFLIAGFQPGAEQKSLYLSLVGLSGKTDYTPEQAIKDLGTIFEAVKGPLSGELLLRLIRAVRYDPHYEPVVDTAEAVLKKSLADRLGAEYGRRRTALAEGIRSEAIAGMLKKLFGGADLHPVAGWTDAESATLMDNGMQGLSNLNSITALKSFLPFRYADKIRPVISEAVVELDFADTDFRRSLSDTADSVDRVRAMLDDFEASVMIPGQSGYARYLTALREGSLDAAGLRSASRAVEAVRAKADAVIQAAFSELGALSEYLLALQEDIRSGDPRIVYKISSLDQRRRAIADKLAEETKMLVSFLKLLRMLSVDRDRAKQSMDKLAMNRKPAET